MTNNGLSKAQLILQQLKVNYLAELPEKLNDLEQLALQLIQDSNYSENFDELYRKTHSLKGSAGTYGLPAITGICHEMEDSLSGNASSNKKDVDALVDRCLAYIDLMRQVTTGASRGENVFPDIEAALTTLRTSRVGQLWTAVLVEPSRVNTALYLGVLKEFPIEFSVRETGYDALELLLHNRFDLLITGYETPLLNGAALIAAMRLCACQNESTPAVLITSNTNVCPPASVGPNLILPRDAHVASNLLEAVRGFVKGGKRAQ